MRVLAKDFLASLTEREIKVAAYEVASSDALRVATIVDRTKVDASFVTSGTKTYCGCAETVDT